MAGYSGHWSNGRYSGPNKEGVAAAAAASSTMGVARVASEGHFSAGTWLNSTAVLSPRAQYAELVRAFGEKSAGELSRKALGQRRAAATRAATKRKDAEDLAFENRTYERALAQFKRTGVRNPERAAFNTMMRALARRRQAA